MNSNLSRREFLKTAALLMLIGSDLPSIEQIQSADIGDGQPSDVPPNILILVFDALSARNMSLYGYPRQTTPNIARLANRATVFHRHYAPGSFTTSGTASLLTGVYPWSHRALHSRGRAREEYADKNIFSVLSSDFYKLAHTQNNLVTQLLDHFSDHIQELLKATETGLTSGSIAEKRFWNDFNAAYQGESTLLGYYHELPSLLLSSTFNKLKGFRISKVIREQYGELYPRGVPQTGDHMYLLLENAMDWILAQINRIPQPYLAYIHLWPPHDPYRTRIEFVDSFIDDWVPPPKVGHKFSQGHSDELLIENRRYYDEYIAFVDAEFGRLYDNLENAGILDKTILVLTSDHGEMFERGIYGHLTPALFEPVIHIPLLISRPGQTCREDIFTPTSGVDLLPTICSFSGQTTPAWIEGQILPAYHPNPIDRDIYVMDSKHIPKNGAFDRGSIALIRDQYKLVHYSGYEGVQDRYEVYNLVNDPEELDNRFYVETSIAKELIAALSEKIERINRPIHPEITL